MPIDVNGTSISGGTSVTATDSNGNIIFNQNSNGQVTKPQNSSGSTLIPLFSAGMSGSTWSQYVSSGSWGKIPYNYGGGSGYLNVNGCYDLTNSRFTAPWTGFYLFKSHCYIYGNDGGGSWYCHPMYWVNGSSNLRRAGGTLYRIRQYGLYASYGQDTDISELIYLTAGDYVEVYWYSNGNMQSYDPYCYFSGCYMGY